MRMCIAVVIGVTSIALVAAGQAAAKNTQLHAVLSGVQEVPGPGDGDGLGTAEVDVKTKRDKKKAEICFRLEWSGIGQPIGGHIHDGAAGTDGPIVVPLFEGAAGVCRRDGLCKDQGQDGQAHCQEPRRLLRQHPHRRAPRRRDPGPTAPPGALGPRTCAACRSSRRP